MSIIDLQETSPNTWRAKYRGNYGTYTIKIKTDGNKTVDFSCSCPSDYYPCKHIAMIESAIEKRIAECKQSNKGREITVGQLLKDLPQKELYDFLVRQAKYNPDLKNTILLEFAHKTNNKETNNYSLILRKALTSLRLDYEDVEYDGDIEIDVMDQWLDKAQSYVKQNNPGEAILICKACIEEYASWYEKQGDIADYIDISYREWPFDILAQTLPMQGVNHRELFEYCKSEMSKSKYKKAEMDDGFNDLFMKLSSIVGSNDFVAFQDKLLHELKDKSSYEAQKILQRKIDFYRNNKQEDKARRVIEENLQIESFRKEWTEKLIAEHKLPEAKRLINDFISANRDKNRYPSLWYDLKLQIAQKESDMPIIRETSFRFIEGRFDAKYHKIYKSTFGKEEWPREVENLIRHYEKENIRNWINSNIADLLFAEKQAERLMEYIEKYLSVDNLERYYLGFSSSFPEKTLTLFRQAIDEYAKNNTGREYYERIVKLFGKMIKIEGGGSLVKEMINQYRIVYKNRSAMMEIINRF